METQKQKSTREILLKAARMIVRMNQRSLTIIKERKMYHTKLIERSSKCTKDPNPLATTMILLNQKYPIAIAKEEAKRYGVPSSLLFIDKNREIEDSHIHGHVLAKLESIDWWITHSSSPNESLRKLADLLFKSLDVQCQEYYDINWSSTRIQWGPPTLQRSLVRTNKPLVDLPPSLRNAAIKEVFFPDFSTSHPRVTTGAIQELKDYIELTIDDNIPLTRQIRIILNSLDPRERYLPVLPSSGESTVIIKHAVVHNNFVLINYATQSCKDEKLWLGPFKNLVASTIHESKVQSIPIGEIKEILLSSKVLNIDFTTLLESIRVTDSIEFLWLKALFDKPTTLEHTVGKLTVCPDPREGREIRVYNKKMIPRVIKMGNQVVNFKYLGMRGKFVYNGQLLIELVSNYTTARDLLSLLKEIAKYIAYRYQDTTDYKQLNNNRTIERFVDLSPHKFLECSITQLSKIGQLREGESCGKFRFQPNSEYITTGCFHVTLDEKLDVLLPGTQLKVTVDIPKENLKPFSDAITCKHMRMIRCFSLKETVKELYYYYLNNSSEVVARIMEKNFTWKNSHMRKFTGGMGKQISYMARNIALRLMDSARSNWHYLCFIYCFCNADPRDSSFGPLSYTLPDGTIIDMSAEQGIFSYSSTHNSYLLYGAKVGRELRKISKAELMKGVLEGYKISHPAKEGNKLVSLKTLETCSNKFPEGSSQNAYIGGTLYTFTKDSSITYGMRSTINRHLEETIRRIESQGKKVILGKRWLDSEELDYDHLSPERKKRKIEEESIVMEYTDEIVVGTAEEIDSDTEDVFQSDDDI